VFIKGVSKVDPRLLHSKGTHFRQRPNFANKLQLGMVTLSTYFVITYTKPLLDEPICTYVTNVWMKGSK